MRLTEVTFREELTPPESWQDAGFEPSQYVSVDTVETGEDDAYRLLSERVGEPWDISRENVVDVSLPAGP